MNPSISQTIDGWYVGAGSAEGSNPVLPSDLQFTQPAPNNTLGLEVGHNANSSPHLANSAYVTHHSTPSNGSRYIQTSPHATPVASPFLQHSTTSPDLPSPYRLRTIAGGAASAGHLSLAGAVAQGPTMPPASSAPPQLRLQLPHIVHVYNPTSQLEIGPQRKRMRRDSPEHSQEGPSLLTQPNLLRAPVPAHAVPITPLPICVASVNVPLVTQRPVDVRPINDNRDRDRDEVENVAPTGDDDYDMDGEDAILTGDDRVVESLYEETLKGDAVELRKLFDVVNELLKTQVDLSQSVRQIDTCTQQLAAINTTCPPNGAGSYVSPPEPPEPINWDQPIWCDEPAGRRRRARWRISLMALIRETIFKLLSRRSVHDPLPPPPPRGLRVPTLLEFAICWDEYHKSIFNQLAADIVVQKISIEQPGMLTPEEWNELPSMVSSHIKYLCWCYKDQNQDNAKDFNALRLRRCAVGTRKRQLFATRLQVLDRFPEHLGKHCHLIVHLGVDGTSSNEEDPKGSGTYKIKKKPQLSSKVTLLKRDLDHVYQLYFKGPGTKGSQVHRHIPSDIDSTRPFTIQGLPLPCISRAWYQELDPAEREFYQFTPHNYDFSFPMSLLNVRESGWPVGERSRNVSP